MLIKPCDSWYIPQKCYTTRIFLRIWRHKGFVMNDGPACEFPCKKAIIPLRYFHHEIIYMESPSPACGHMPQRRAWQRSNAGVSGAGAARALSVPIAAPHCTISMEIYLQHCNAAACSAGIMKMCTPPLPKECNCQPQCGWQLHSCGLLPHAAPFNPYPMPPPHHIMMAGLSA